MTGLDWAALTRLVPEIAIVTVFVWFTLERDKRQHDESKSNQSEWRRFLDEQRESFLAALQDNNDLYREGMGRLAEEIKALTLQTNSMNAMLSMHDQQAREFIRRAESKAQ